MNLALQNWNENSNVPFKTNFYNYLNYPPNFMNLDKIFFTVSSLS